MEDLTAPDVRDGVKPDFKNWWYRTVFVTSIRQNDPPRYASLDDLKRFGLVKAYCSSCGMDEHIDHMDDLCDPDVEDTFYGGFLLCRYCVQEYI